MATPILVNGASGLAATAIFVKGQDTKVFSLHIENPSNAAAFVQMFDTLLGPTLGTTVPTWSISVPTLAVCNLCLPTDGIYFKNGLWMAATTAVGGSSAPNAALNVNIGVS